MLRLKYKPYNKNTCTIRNFCHQLNNHYSLLTWIPSCDYLFALFSRLSMITIGTRSGTVHIFLNQMRKSCFVFIERWLFTGLSFSLSLSLSLYSQTTPSSERRKPAPGNVFSTLCWQANPQLWHKSAQTIIPPYQHRDQRDWAVAEWNGEPYIQIYQ